MISESQHFSICIVERWKKSMGYRFVPACNHAQESRLFLPYLPDHRLRCRYHGNRTWRLLLSRQNSLVPRALSQGRKRENPGNEFVHRTHSLFGNSYPPFVIRRKGSIFSFHQLPNLCLGSVDKLKISDLGKMATVLRLLSIFAPVRRDGDLRKDPMSPAIYNNHSRDIRLSLGNT